MTSLNPIRDLEPGDRPRDWMEPMTTEPMVESESTPAASEATAELTPPIQTAPARLEPQRYRVQFEASEEYVELVERAKALLSHEHESADLAELHLRAMRALVAELERRKYAVTAQPRPSQSSRSEPPKPKPKSAAQVKPPKLPRQRGRHVPAVIRRAVFERDAGRCTYRCDTGERCRETARLELHHEQAFALGGRGPLENITLRCRAHNALAAEEDFGKELIASARNSSQHEPWAAQDPDDAGRLRFSD